MKVGIALTVVALTVFLAGCGTVYKPLERNGGYIHNVVASNEFIVRYVGNYNTDLKTAADLALLRSAEITLLYRFKYFRVVESEEEVSSRVDHGGPPTMVMVGTSPMVFGGDATAYVQPVATNSIVCFAEEPEEPFHDAAALVESLRAQYGLPKWVVEHE